jgi:hypothetical protein
VLDITTAWTPENVVCAFARNADIGAETTVKDAANFAIAAVAIEADVPIVAAPARNAAIADTASKSAVEAPVAPVVTRIKRRRTSTDQKQCSTGRRKCRRKCRGRCSASRNRRREWNDRR